VDRIDLSLIIVTLNTRDLLRRALTSIRESNDTFSKEVIVVDNGSTDGTEEMISQEFPEVLYLHQSRNFGFAQANNRGARHAHGRYLCLMNSDARLKPTTLIDSISFMEKNPQCGVVGAQLLNTDGTRQNSIANFPSLVTELVNKSLLRAIFPEKYPGKEVMQHEPMVVESVIGAFFLTRRDLWNQLGGLDERYFFFLEETDYCLRVQNSGFKVQHLPQMEVWHDQGQTAKKVHIPARIEYWRSRYLYFELHHGPCNRWLLACGLLLRLGVGFAGNLILAIFKDKYREKCALQIELILWHLRGCPANGGLSIGSRKSPT